MNIKVKLELVGIINAQLNELDEISKSQQYDKTVVLDKAKSVHSNLSSLNSLEEEKKQNQREQERAIQLQMERQSAAMDRVNTDMKECLSISQQITTAHSGRKRAE
jgi:small-conductance mechanosensitive channel